VKILTNKINDSTCDETRLVEVKATKSVDLSPKRFYVKSLDLQIICKILKGHITHMLTYEDIFDNIKLNFNEHTHLFRNNKYSVYSKLKKEKCFVLLDKNYWILDPEYELVLEENSK